MTIEPFNFLCALVLIGWAAAIVLVLFPSKLIRWIGTIMLMASIGLLLFLIFIQLGHRF